MRDLLRQLVVIVSLVFTLTSNALANILPLNGLGTGEISDRFPVPVTPAGYVFSIWGLIYLGLTAFTVVHSLPARREDAKLRSVGWIFALSNLFNGLWIYAWHYLSFPLSLLLMLGLLASLIAIYLRLEIGSQRYGGLDRWTISAPFSIYLGWITIATVANVTITLYDAGFGGFGIPGTAWAIALFCVAAGLGLWMIFRRDEAAYPAVLIWALIGVAQNQAALQAVAVAAAALAGLLLLTTIGQQWRIYRDRRLA